SAFADVSIQKSLVRELELRRREAEEASVRKTRFLAAVSHDIRTPVNAINLLAELIRRLIASPEMSDQIPELAERLQANALSLIEMVNDVLDIARFDTGKIEIQESEFSLGELIDDECRQLLPLAEDKGLGLSVEPPVRPLRVRTDRVKLGRVIGNLVANAIKFTDRGGVTVRVTMSRERGVLIDIADSGIGIAAEHIDHIFDEFIQIRNPARDRSKGTGLGLAISQRLISVMGGSISVESTPGDGSTFTIALPASVLVLSLDTLPLQPVPEPRPDWKAPQSQLLNGLRVLLIEDHTV